MSRETRVLRIYAERDHVDAAHRKELVDIVKALSKGATLEQQRASYGTWPEQFELVSAPDAADVHMLPMRWQHYVEHGRVDQARRAVEVARKARRPIAVFSLSDYEANFPIAGVDIHLFQASAYRSRDQVVQHGMPPFFDDPLATYGDGEIVVRDKGAKPIVGFCGQAGASLAHHAARLVRNRIKRMRWRLGRERWEPPPLEHTWFRQRVLDAFTRGDAIETRFVLRAKYRAGVRDDTRNDPAVRARREFLDNLRDTDYTIAMRGNGNFSVRFYEALAMGRIPAFVDTNCVLPYRSQIDWRHYVPWIDVRDLRDAPRIVAEFHARLSPAEFRERQLACRQLWLDRLTPDGFYAHFREHFPELA